MRNAVAPALAFALLVLVVSFQAGSAPPAAPVIRSLTWDVTAIACDAGDGVCLVYDGATPGPLLDIALGEVVHITLVNRIAETLAALDVPAEVKAPLADARVSFHVHGTSIAAAMDGVSAHPGTQLIDSSVAPGGSHTYVFRAAYAGTWHYHDHVLGADGGAGTIRGLFGSLVVRNGAEARPSAVHDLHLHNNGANLGAGLDATGRAGESFDLVVVGLGDRVWNVTLDGPQGRVTAFDIGPGMSQRIAVKNALAGSYTWTARWAGEMWTGAVVVQ